LLFDAAHSLPPAAPAVPPKSNAVRVDRDQLFKFRRNLANFAVVGGGPVTIASHQVLFRACLAAPIARGDKSPTLILTPFSADFSVTVDF
jgi:hypothetical protein